MNIYIYGSKSFKNNIQDVLEHANMKFRLSSEDAIVELSSLHKLKEAIEDDPKDIFLIDDEKIIKKNTLNDKIKFLKPKDGIEEEFLKEYGIGDLSVDDIEDIATHVIKKLEKAHAKKENFKEEYVDKQNSTIASKNNEYEFVHSRVKEQSSEPEIEAIQNKEIPEKKGIDDEDYDFNIDDLIDFNDDEDEKILEENSFEDEIFKSRSEENLEEEDFGLVVKKIEKKGEDDMSDEFSELDSLNEDELLEALNEPKSNKKEISRQEGIKKSGSGAEVELNSSSINEISSLITQLLNNKTLEITIKIKE